MLGDPPSPAAGALTALGVCDTRPSLTAADGSRLFPAPLRSPHVSCALVIWDSLFQEMTVTFSQNSEPRSPRRPWNHSAPVWGQRGPWRRRSGRWGCPSGLREEGGSTLAAPFLPSSVSRRRPPSRSVQLETTGVWETARRARALPCRAGQENGRGTGLRAAARDRVPFIPSYEFPVAAATNDRKLGGLKQQKFILLQL